MDESYCVDAIDAVASAGGADGGELRQLPRPDERAPKAAALRQLPTDQRGYPHVHSRHILRPVRSRVARISLLMAHIGVSGMHARV